MQEYEKTCHILESYKKIEKGIETVQYVSQFRKERNKRARTEGVAIKRTDNQEGIRQNIALDNMTNAKAKIRKERNASNTKARLKNSNECKTFENFLSA